MVENVPPLTRAPVLGDTVHWAPLDRISGRVSNKDGGERTVTEQASATVSRQEFLEKVDLRG